MMLSLVPNFLQLSIQNLRKTLILPLLGIVLVSTELTKSPLQLFPKLASLVFFLYIILKYRNHLTSSCLSPNAHILKKQNRFTFLVAFYILFTMLRPIFFSVSSFRLGTLYWPLQTLMFFTAMYLWKHSLRCDQGLIKSKNSVCSISISNLVVLALTLYLVLYEFIYLVGDLNTPLNISFTSTASQLLPYLLLFPYLWIHLRDEKFLIVGYVPIVLAFLLSVQTESRSNMLLVIVSTATGVFCILVYRKKSWIEKTKILSPLFIASIVAIFFGFSRVKSLVNDLILTGTVRHLDTGYTEVVDQDRFLHLETSWRVSLQDFPTFLFGYGFRESSFVLADPLRKVYELELAHLDLSQELESMTNISTFGLGAIILDFGLVGAVLMLLLLLRQILKLPWSRDFGWSILRLISILSLLSMLYVFNFTESVYFLVLLFLGNERDANELTKSEKEI